MKSRFSALTVLYAMILIAALLLTLFGARLYTAVSARRAENNLRRSTLSYLQSKLQSADASSGVAIRSGPEGDLLALREGETGYEARIYRANGSLVEELSPVGSELRPDAAQIICAADSFSVRSPQDGVLTITADGAQAIVCLRSEGGILNAAS